MRIKWIQTHTTTDNTSIRRPIRARGKVISLASLLGTMGNKQHCDVSSLSACVQLAPAVVMETTTTQGAETQFSLTPCSLVTAASSDSRKREKKKKKKKLISAVSPLLHLRTWELERQRVWETWTPFGRRDGFVPCRPPPPRPSSSPPLKWDSP